MADDLRLALELFRDPLLAGATAGATLGALSVFVLLRRMVFATAALTQAAGLGVALAFLLPGLVGASLPPAVGATATALGAALVVALPPERLHLSRDAVLAALWLVGSGGAVLVGSRIGHEAQDVESILFGSAVLVRPVDLVQILAVGALVLVATALLGSRWIQSGFDPDGARVQGLPVRTLDALLLVLLTLLVAVCTRALGALPVFALSVLPGVAALLAAGRMASCVPLAALAGAFAGVAGYLLAFFADLPVGASQMAVAAGLAALAAPVRLWRGAVPGAPRRRPRRQASRAASPSRPPEAGAGA